MKTIRVKITIQRIMVVVSLVILVPTYFILLISDLEETHDRLFDQWMDVVSYKILAEGRFVKTDTSDTGSPYVLLEGPVFEDGRKSIPVTYKCFRLFHDTNSAETQFDQALAAGKVTKIIFTGLMSPAPSPGTPASELWLTYCKIIKWR